MARSLIAKSVFWLLLIVGGLGIAVAGCAELFGDILGGGGGGGNQDPKVEIDETDLKTTLSPGEKATIFILFSDPDGDEVGISWQVVNLETGDEQLGALKISDNFATFTAPVVTVSTKFKINVTADDGGGGKDTASITITVERATDEALFVLDEEFVDIALPTNGTATATVKATALKKDGDTDDLKVGSDDESVAEAKVEKKEEDGSTHLITITAKDVGETDVFVTADSTGETKSIHVEVFKSGEAFLSLGGVTVVNVLVDETVEIEANAKKADGSDDEIKAESSNTNFATVEVIDNIVKISGESVGVTEVTVESVGGKIKKKVDVNVIKAGEAQLTVDPSGLLFIPVGKKKTLKVTAITSEGNVDSVSASSSLTSVATISFTGSSGNTFTYEVNGGATGDATITFESGSKLTKVTNVKVDVAPILLLDRKTATIVIDGTPDDIQVIAAIDADGKADTFTAEIDDVSVATISIGGDIITITPVAVGPAEITVKLGSDPTITATIAVSVVTTPPGIWGTGKWGTDVFGI